MGEPIKAIIWTYASDPSDDEGHVQLSILLDLPFVPPIGSLLMPVKGGNYVIVGGIHVDPFAENTLIISVPFAAPLPHIDLLIDEGWERDD